MERFNDVAGWAVLTIAQLRSLAQSVGIPVPSKLNKPELITTVVNGIRSRFPDLAERVQTYSSAFGRSYEPGRKTARMQSIDWYVGLGQYLSSGQVPEPAALEGADEALPLPEIQPAEPSMDDVLRASDLGAADAQAGLPNRSAAGDLAGRSREYADGYNEGYRLRRRMTDEEAQRLIASYRVPAAGPAIMRAGPAGTPSIQQPAARPLPAHFNTVQIGSTDGYTARVANRPPPSLATAPRDLNTTEQQYWLEGARSAYGLRRLLTPSEILVIANQTFGEAPLPLTDTQKIAFAQQGAIQGAAAAAAHVPLKQVRPPDIGPEAQQAFMIGVREGYRLGHALTDAEARIALSIQPVSKGRPIPYVSEQFLRWLLQNPNRVQVDIKGQQDLITAAGYGHVDIRRSYSNFVITPSDIKEISAISGNPIPPEPYKGMMGLVTPDSWRVINAYLQTIMRTGKVPSEPLIVPGFPKVQLYFEAGKGRDAHKEGGFPRLTFSNDSLTWSTPPFGLSAASLPITVLILNISGVSVDDYLLYSKITFDEKQNRKLAYLLSVHPEIPVVPDARVKGPFDLPLSQLKEHIANFPTVAKALFPGSTGEAIKRRIDGINVPRNLTLGARQRLYRYMSAHPEEYKKTRPPTTGTLPFALEDYIPDGVWDKLPSEIQQYAGPVQVVPNPYALLFPGTVSRIAFEREIQLSREGKAADQLNVYDVEVEAKWKKDILRTDLADLGNLSATKRAFYMAAHGVREIATPRNLDPVLFARAVINLTDAGGIGRDIKEAAPLIKRFVDDILNLTPSREYLETICRLFNIESYELLTVDQIRDLFVRGYVQPLPISQEVMNRYTSWKALSPDKQRMLATIYGFPVENVASFANRQPTTIATKMEAYVIQLSAETADTIVRELGFVVPYPVTALTYVTEALPLCLELTRRPADFKLESLSSLSHVDALARMTDTEITQRVGAYYTYRSRSELVSRGAALLSGTKGFFIPYERKCVNPYTVTSSAPLLIERGLAISTAPGEEELFLISFGTLKEYVCYQMEELTAGFLPHGENKDQYAYQIIKANGKDFDRLESSQASDLLNLVTQLLPSFDKDRFDIAEQLIHAIERVDMAIRGANEYDRVRYKQFLTFPADVRQAMFNYLMQLFDTGMYMRRWRGPPDPYPLASAETERQDFSEDVHVLPQFEILVTRLETLRQLDKSAADFILKLRQVEHKGGFATQAASDNANIADLVDRVVHRRNECIRINSRYFIGTGVYYLSLFYNYSVPGYDITRLEQIS